MTGQSRIERSRRTNDLLGEGMAFYDSIDNDANFFVRFASDPRHHFGVFAKAYRLGAEQISKNLIEKGNFPVYEAFPVVFLFRHSLELHLKNIIYKAEKLATFRERDDIDAKLYNWHDLTMLADKASKLMRLLFREDQSIREVINSFVTTSHEFTEIDPSSFSYRYPIDKKGNPSTKRGQKTNLRAIAEHMSGLLEDLEAIDFGLDAETYTAQERQKIDEVLRDIVG